MSKNRPAEIQKYRTKLDFLAWVTYPENSCTSTTPQRGKGSEVFLKNGFKWPLSIRYRPIKRKSQWISGARPLWKLSSRPHFSLEHFSFLKWPYSPRRAWPLFIVRASFIIEGPRLWRRKLLQWEYYRHTQGRSEHCSIQATCLYKRTRLYCARVALVLLSLSLLWISNHPQEPRSRTSHLHVCSERSLLSGCLERNET